MVVSKASDIASAYLDVVSFPSPVSGSLSLGGEEGTLLLQSLWSGRDVVQKSKATTVRTHIINKESNKVVCQTEPHQILHELWNRTSPTGNLRAVVRSNKDKKNEEKQYIEIYDKTRKLKTIDVLALENHAKIIDDDGQFGSFEWSSAEGHIMYMAEKKKEKTQGFFDHKTLNHSDDGAEEPATAKEKKTIGDEFKLVDTWGEQLKEKSHPVICILDVESETVSVLENVPDNVSPAQAIWTSDDSGVVYVAWNHSPYRLGLKFCTQRKSSICHLDIHKGTIDILSDEGRAVRSPRFSPDMNKLVYFDSPIAGPHSHCARLVLIDWATKERRIVIDTVPCALSEEFPGIYTFGITRRMWLDDNVHLAFSTNWRSSLATVVVNTSTGQVRRICKDSEKGSMALLDVYDNTLLLSCSTLNQPFHLLLAKLKDTCDLEKVDWLYPDGEPQEVDWLTWTVFTHKPSKERMSKINAALDYESILCLPKKAEGEKLPPLILFLHGGPNSAFDNSFQSISNFFCCCGYAVLMVNYRGSLGFGQDNILSLCGAIGDQDVNDCEAAMMEILAKGKVDPNRIMVFGGSHGGFLTTHLIGQYPDSFKAGASRNPVVDLVSMHAVTDIPDWTFAQAGLPFDYDSIPDEEVLKTMWKASPKFYINQVKTPMLLMIGMDDKRVPPSQGLDYFKALKARNVPARCLSYPGNNHSISNVDAEADCMVNTVVWFNTYL